MALDDPRHSLTHPLIIRRALPALNCTSTAGLPGTLKKAGRPTPGRNRAGSSQAGTQFCSQRKGSSFPMYEKGPPVQAEGSAWGTWRLGTTETSKKRKKRCAKGVRGLGAVRVTFAVLRAPEALRGLEQEQQDLHSVRTDWMGQWQQWCRAHRACPSEGSLGQGGSPASHWGEESPDLGLVPSLGNGETPQDAAPRRCGSSSGVGACSRQP